MNGHEVSAFTTTLSATLKESYRYGESALSPTALQEKRSFRLLGWPLHNTLAPLIHNKLFSLRGIPWHYSVLESKDPQDLIVELDDEQAVGSAVTMPHKLVFTQHVDVLNEEATAVGALNTIFFRRNKDGRKIRVGGNTDVLGVRESFVNNASKADIEKAATRPGLIVGCGGAARSSVYALWRFFGVKKFYLANRLKSEADDVASQFTKLSGFDATFEYLSTGEEAKAAETPFFVVGTVPDHPPSSAEEHAVQDIMKELLTSEQRERGVVLEMCYHPKVQTTLYNLCEAAGWTVIPGTEATLWQDVVQHLLWTEKEGIQDVWVKETRTAIWDAIEESRRKKAAEL